MDNKLKSDVINFYYFSGTGNTLLVVRKMKSVLEAHGKTVKLHRIETSDPTKVDISGAIGLGFTVAEQGTYLLVWDFIEAMPKAKATQVFMIDTMMKFSGGVIGPIGKRLRRKGYQTIGAKEIFMPNNFFPRKDYVEKNKRKIEKGFVRTEKYALCLLEGKTRWGRIPILSDFMGAFSRMKSTWAFFRKFLGFHIDEDKCDKCGLCVKLCPINNITIDDYPVFDERCITCMRCISYCPQDAILSKKFKKATHYRAVKAADLLKDE